MSLIYKIKADGSGYTKTVSRLRNDTKKFSGDVKGQMLGIGTAIKGAFAMVGVNAFKGIMDDITQLGRLTRALGEDFEGFQTLSNAARQFGVDAETVADALKDLNVRIQEGAVEGGSMAEEFAQLGLDVDELSTLMPIEQFYALSDAIKDTGGNMARMGLDRINDAMFRLGPLAELGADGIQRLGDESAKFSKSQLEMAEKGSKAWDNLMHNLSFAAATIASFVIPLFQTLAEVVIGTLGELAIQSSLFIKGIKATFTGDFAGAKAAFSTMGEMATTALGRISDDIADVWKDADDAANNIGKGAGGRGGDAPERSDDSKTELEKELNKQLEEQEKRRQALMDDEEKLLDLQKRRIAAEKELGELGERLHRDGATDEEAIELAKLQTKWEKLQTEEQAQQLKIKKQLADFEAKSAKDAEALVDAQIDAWLKEGKELKEKEDKEKEKKDKELEDQKEAEKGLASTQEDIAAERKRREEMGMSDEELLARRQAELKQQEQELAGLGQDANGDGKIDTADDQFRADKELDIENLKSEIKGLELGIEGDVTDPQTGVISSSLAAIGGGGGVAAFGDPVLTENKKQTTVLEGIRRAIENSNPETNGVFENPEL